MIFFWLLLVFMEEGREVEVVEVVAEAEDALMTPKRLSN